MSELIDFGCICHSEKIVLPFMAKQSGKHQIKIEHKGSNHYIPFHAVKGFRFKIKNEFNENKESLFEIIQPDGSLYRHTYADRIGIAGYECGGVTKFLIKVEPCFSHGFDHGIEEMVIDECNYQV